MNSQIWLLVKFRIPQQQQQCLAKKKNNNSDNNNNYTYD